MAGSLWKSWNIEGHFDDYLKQRIALLLHEIEISNNANAQIRAFKSLYWAPRWTSTNLSVFESQRPITLPYYDNRMCEFICTVPGKYLSGRQIQIAYLKKRMPSLAKIMWQEHRPFNLYNYEWDRKPFNLPYKVYDKLKRMVYSKPTIQRNWELQFLGNYNDSELQKWLFENQEFKQLVPQKVVLEFYQLFKSSNDVYYSHAVSMLLTLSLFSKQKK